MSEPILVQVISFFYCIGDDSLKFVHPCRREKWHFQCNVHFFYCHWVEWLTSWHSHRPTALKLRIKPLSTTITLLSRYEVVHNIRPHPSNTHLRYLAKLESQSASFVDPIPNLNTLLSQGTIFPSSVTFHRTDILTSDIVMMAFILSRGWVEWFFVDLISYRVMHRHTWTRGRVDTTFVNISSRWVSKHFTSVSYIDLLFLCSDALGRQPYLWNVAGMVLNPECRHRPSILEVPSKPRHSAAILAKDFFSP